MGGIMGEFAAMSTSGSTGTYSGTITCGTLSGSNGYASGAYGSLSPTTDSNGKTIQSAITFPGSYDYLQMQISPDPGAGYFTTATINGNANTSATAVYSYVGGTATWTWSGVGTFHWALPTSGSFAMTLT